jgi:bifunctional DNA-binding transcriptional regulator/antitoxin component of YhaV-PrlF toxin-antitoxin module
MESVSGEEPKVYRSKLDASGRVVLAADLRSALDLHEGDTVLLVKEGETVRIETPEQALKAAQHYFCKLAPPERMFSEELLEERRDEAARE